MESRKIYLSADLAGYLDFPYVQVVFKLERTRSKLDGSGRTTEVVYGLTSRNGTGKKDAEKLLADVRGHWTVESLHWIRDMTYDEDRSQIRRKNGPRVMASLRNLAISVLRLAGAPSIAKAARWCGRHVEECARLVGLF